MCEKLSSLNKQNDKVKKKYDDDCKYLLATKKGVGLFANNHNSYLPEEKKSITETQERKKIPKKTK
jgi:hypothetical protein